MERGAPRSRSTKGMHTDDPRGSSVEGHPLACASVGEGDLRPAADVLAGLLDRLADATPRDLLTRPEAARALGVSLSTIDRMRADGQLAEVLIRGRVFIPRAEVTRLVADSRRRGDDRHGTGVALAGPMW